MSRKKREGEYYIVPKVFKASLKKYYDTDVLTDDLAENIKKISYGLSYNSNFINYTYKDDMIGDALVKMYAALKYKKYHLKGIFYFYRVIYLFLIMKAHEMQFDYVHIRENI